MPRTALMLQCLCECAAPGQTNSSQACRACVAKHVSVRSLAIDNKERWIMVKASMWSLVGTPEGDGGLTSTSQRPARSIRSAFHIMAPHAQRVCEVELPCSKINTSTNTR
uniref:Secreted protein n=1 Tax=Ascaris lumbricoides TaxID=6252 RepID=A0A0M3I041_ASCLU